MKIIIIAVITCLVAYMNVAYAQNITAENPMPVYFSVNVSDLYTSMAWYEKHLKLRPADRNEYPDLGYNKATLKNENIVVDIYDRESKDTIYTIEDMTPGISSVGLMVNNYEDWMIFVIREKVRITGTEESNPVNGKRAMTMRDPDGNSIIIMEE